MKVIGHLGFRSGSKGLKGKNIKLLNGKPLFLWTLEQLLRLEYISGVIVSTDNADAYKTSVDLGALDIGIRSKDLSGDNIAKLDVWKDSARRYLDLGYDFDAMLDLDCTSPLRTEEDISGVLEKFIATQREISLAITQARKNPYFNLLEESADGFLKISKGDGHVFARQSAPDVYEHVSSIYVISKDFLLNGERLYDARMTGYEIPYERSFDIDSDTDWQIINMLFNRK